MPARNPIKRAANLKRKATALDTAAWNFENGRISAKVLIVNIRRVAAQLRREAERKESEIPG